MSIDMAWYRSCLIWVLSLSSRASATASIIGLRMCGSLVKIDSKLDFKFVSKSADVSGVSGVSDSPMVIGPAEARGVKGLATRVVTGDMCFC